MPTENETHIAIPTAPITCTATADRAADQLLEWTELQQLAKRREPIDGGARMVFAATLTDQVRDLARREAGCCSFLTISTTLDHDELVLDITAADPNGRAVVALLSGLPVS